MLNKLLDFLDSDLLDKILLYALAICSTVTVLALIFKWVF